MSYAPEAVLRMIDILNESGARYFVTGALATNVYRIGRSTNDADFVVDLAPERLADLFEKMKQEFEQEPQMAFETVTGKFQHRFYFRKSSFLIEIFEANLNDAHEQARFRRMLKGDVEGRNAFIPTAEDVVIQKLRWIAKIRRPKDRDDVVEVFMCQKMQLDWSYIEQWCREHGTLEILGVLKQEAESTLNESRLP